MDTLTNPPIRIPYDTLELSLVLREHYTPPTLTLEP